MYIYIHIYVHIYTYICMHIYVCIAEHQSNSPDLQCPDRPWRSPDLLPANIPGFSPWVKRQRRECNLFRSVPRLWILGAVPSLTYTSKWHVYSTDGQTYLLLFNVNKNPTRCNSMQIFIYCKTTLHVSNVTAPIIRSTKNCTRSLRYRS